MNKRYHSLCILFHLLLLHLPFLPYLLTYNNQTETAMPINDNYIRIYTNATGYLFHAQSSPYQATHSVLKDLVSFRFVPFIAINPLPLGSTNNHITAQLSRSLIPCCSPVTGDVLVFELGFPCMALLINAALDAVLLLSLPLPAYTTFPFACEKFPLLLPTAGLGL